MMTGSLTQAAERLERAAKEFGAAYQELRELATSGLRELHQAHGPNASNRVAGVAASFDHLELEAAGALAASGCGLLFESGIHGPAPVTDFAERWERRDADLTERLSDAQRGAQRSAPPQPDAPASTTSRYGTPLSALHPAPRPDHGEA